MPWNDMELKASRKDVAGPKIPKTRKKTYFFFRIPRDATTPWKK